MYQLSDLDPKLRSVELTVEDIDKLVTAYKYLLEKYPDIGMYEYRASRRIVPLSNTKDLQVIDYVEDVNVEDSQTIT